MDYKAILTESAGYAKEALWGRWARWLIFIICSLPMALVPFVMDPKKIFTGTAVHWETVPWGELAVIVVVGILLSFFVAGYIVRVYRGVSPAPEFDDWGTLFIDGIRLTVVGILWFIPLMAVLALMLATAFLGMAGGRGASAGLWIGLVLVLVVIEIALAVVTVLYSILGSVRFSRTGSILEGIRFTAITGTIRTIGWGRYVIALVILMVVAIAFFAVMSVFSLVPYAGWVVQLVLTPLYSIFSARYISRVYDHGVPQAAAP
ncbi:MAG: DUF4013 domain-containing protein [Methanoregula sp.]|jgi:hypothetical protein|uniref:DUF4013 domain-containing protein n=1 Tax=Methanoregula sp. TaxID=2052170 RepID=UPI003C1692B9